MKLFWKIFTCLLISFGGVVFSISYITLDEITIVSGWALLVLGMILYLAVRHYTKPIKELTAGTEAIGKGNLAHRVKIGSKDELAQLADSFNKMAEDLQMTTVSKDYVDNIIESMADALIVVDPDRKIRTVNKATCELLGYEEKDLVGNPVEVIISEADKETKLEKLTIGSDVKNFETYLKSKGGKEIPVLFNGSLMKDKDDRPLCIVYTARDITERKRAEEALLNAAQQWRTTFDGISDMVSLLDPEGRIIRCNRAMANFVNKPFREIIGRPCGEVMNCPKVLSKECPILRIREAPRKESLILPINDRWFSGVIDPILDENGRFIGAVQIMSDITERRRAEEALRESEARYRDLVEYSQYLICTHDLTGQILSVNKEASKLLGYDQKDLLQKNIRDLLAPEMRDQFATFLDTICKQGIARGVMLVQTSTGEKRLLEYNNTLRTEGVAEPIVRAMAHDITDKWRAKKEKAALEEQLRQSQKMEAIGHLAGGVAHDFNNLLTIITGYSDLIMSGLAQENRLRQDVQEIKKAAERASSLTRQLLAFSSKQVLQPKVLDLNELVTHMNKMLRRLIGEPIELVTIFAKDLGKIKADPGQVEQVILNLAVNAKDAMPSGGRLIIETENIELNKQYTQTHIGVASGCYVRLSVSDTGIGMSAEIQERIFEPFFTTKEKGKGTGLGLSTVYGIVKQSGGNIWVYSEPGKGSTFKIDFPVIEEEVDSRASLEVSSEPQRGSETILLVEDEEMLRRLARTILQKKGYNVMEAANGEEALYKVREYAGKNIHLLLTDVVMPGMSGRELADCLESLQPELKVLYMSGYTNEAIVHHGVLDPEIAYIQKPFSPDVLAAKVREVLDASAVQC